MFKRLLILDSQVFIIPNTGYYIDIVLVDAGNEQDKELSIHQNNRHVDMSTVRIWKVRLSSTYENITLLTIASDRKLYLSQALSQNSFKTKESFLPILVLRKIFLSEN